MLQSYSHWLQWEQWMFRSVQIFTYAESNVSHDTSSITEILQKMAQRHFKCKTFSYIHLWQNVPFKCMNYPWVEELDMMHYILSYVFLQYFSHLFMTRILFSNTVITEDWFVFWLPDYSTIYPNFFLSVPVSEFLFLEDPYIWPWKYQPVFQGKSIIYIAKYYILSWHTDYLRDERLWCIIHFRDNKIG